jgi:UDP-glucose-4-epimerase GalE
MVSEMGPIGDWRSRRSHALATDNSEIRYPGRLSLSRARLCRRIDRESSDVLSEQPGRFTFVAGRDAGHRARCIVFSSTCATYGVPETTLLDETHRQKPVNPYGETKLAIERALKWYGDAFGLEWVALRFFNAAGADPDGEIGEQHDPETHLIPLVLEAAVTPSRPVVIFGADYPTPDGTAIRDYVHVTDLARAHILALRYLERGGESSAFNLGLERGYSVRDVIASVEQVSGNNVAIVESNRRAGDPAVLVASATRARVALEWHPQFLTLDEIVATACQWREWLSSIVRRKRYQHYGAKATSTSSVSP